MGLRERVPSRASCLIAASLPMCSLGSRRVSAQNFFRLATRPCQGSTCHHVVPELFCAMSCHAAPETLCKAPASHLILASSQILTCAATLGQVTPRSHVITAKQYRYWRADKLCEQITRNFLEEERARSHLACADDSVTTLLCRTFSGLLSFSVALRTTAWPDADRRSDC